MEKNFQTDTKPPTGPQAGIVIPADVPVPSEAAFKWLEHQCVDLDTNPQEIGRLIQKGRTSVLKAFQCNNGPESKRIRAAVLKALTKLAKERASKPQTVAA